MNLSKIVIAQSTLPRFTHATIKPGPNFPKIEVVFFFLYFFFILGLGLGLGSKKNFKLLPIGQPVP